MNQEGDVERYGGMKIRKDETIFAAYDKVGMRKAKGFDSCELGPRAYLQVPVLA